MKVRRAHIYSALFVGCFGVLSAYILFGQKPQTGITENIYSSLPIQYSDREITENAKLQDPRFDQLAFAPSPHRPSSSPRQLANIWRAIEMVFANRDDMARNEHGTWVWTPIPEMTSEYMARIVGEAKNRGVNTIYLSIDSYLDIFVMQDGVQKEKAEQQFVEKLADFIWLAHQNNIAVDAEAGWRNWAEEGHTYKALTIVEFVKKFNTSQPLKFRGLQYDIEPYLLENYYTSDESRQKILANFVKLVDDTVHHLEDSKLALSIAIPDFYDGRDGMTPEFEYKGKKDYVFRHLLNILEKKSGSSVVLMSYRNFAEGKGGSIDVSRNEMQTVKSGRYKTAVVLAQEVGEVADQYTSFHNMPPEYMVAETAKLQSAFAGYRNFAGLSFHYANAYLEVR